MAVYLRPGSIVSEIKRARKTWPSMRACHACGPGSNPGQGIINDSAEGRHKARSRRYQVVFYF